MNNKIIPPIISIGKFSFFPNDIPNIYPTQEKTNDTTPIITNGNNMTLKLFIPIHANERPTANASILVAIDIVRMVIGFDGSIFLSSSSGFNPSAIIFIPNIPNNPNAIQ